MIPARADKKVCPVFLRPRPGFRALGHSFFVKYTSDKSMLFVHFFKFFPVHWDFFTVYGNHSGSFSVFYCIGPPPGPPRTAGP